MLRTLRNQMTSQMSMQPPMPPQKPSTLLLGEMRGASLRLPKREPTK